jgi:plastocyanin
MGRLRLGVGAGAMALVLVASACGGDNKPSSSSGTTSASGSGSGSGSNSASGTASSAPSGSAAVSLPGTVNDHGAGTVANGADLELELDDFYFSPTFITGPAGAKVKLELANEGEKSHTFTVDSAQIDQQVDPGGKSTVEVTLPASGTLAFYCKFHVSGGMQGAFTIG